MEVSELEEGEARFDYNDANIDPDVAFSYIDTRLENVLGHFQRDFDGLVSAETLGPKFGLYGSFLPTQKHPPAVHSNTKPPQNALTSSKPNSFQNYPSKAAPLNLVAPASQHRGAFVDHSALSASDSVGKITSKNENTSNLEIPNKKRSLKLRLKVGSDLLARKKDELYSGLGLSTPSSSTGNDPEDSGGTPIDSPSSILRDMTSVFVPENRLLSPLNESLVLLTKTVRKTSSSFLVDDSSSILGERKQMEVKEVSSRDKSGVLERIKVESLDSKQGLNNDFKVNIRCPGGMLNANVSTSTTNEAAKKLVPLKKRETKRDLINDQLFGPGFTSEESKVVKHVKDCKNVPDVSKHEIDCFRSKVGPEATTSEPQDVKVPNHIDKFPSVRKSKLMGVQSNGVSSFKKEKMSSSLSGPMKDKKSASKDIVKVRNSYKDILDTRVEDQNKQTKPLDMFTGNEALKDQNVTRVGIPAEVDVPQITEVGPAIPEDNWVLCDLCQKWRLLPIGIEPNNLPDKWLCSMLTWLPGRNRCDVSEEETTNSVQDMNLRPIFQNHDSLQANIGHSDLPNSHVVPENIPYIFWNNKSRPEGSSSNMIETSHSSMDAREKKRKSFSEANQPLVEKHVNTVKVNDKDVNGGDLRTKKLKRKTVSNQYETVTLNKTKTESESEQLYVSNGDHRPRDKLVTSVKREPDNTEISMKSKLLDKKVEMPAKKRKMKDWEESQPCENMLESSDDIMGRREKRLKTEVKQESTDVKPLNTKKSMIIKLSASKENLVNTSLMKNQQKVLSAATSSSSKVSGSCRRAASLQEGKGSPVGSVSSFPIRAATNLQKMSPAAGKTISRKSQSQSQSQNHSQRFNDKAEVKHTEDTNGAMIPQSSGKGSLSRSKDKDEKFNIQRVKIKKSDSLTGKEPLSNKIRKVEVDAEVVNDERAKFLNESSAKISNDFKSVSKKVSRRRTSDSIGDEKPTTSLTQNTRSESKVGDMGSSEVNPTDKIRDLNVSVSKVEDSANQNAKRLVTDSGTVKNLSVINFMKEYVSSQTAISAFKRAEESKDYAEFLKTSGFNYECSDAYFDSALKFLYAAFLLEAPTTDFSKSKGADPMNAYSTCAKLSKICAQEYEKREEMASATLAYKCIEVACMRIVYCKSSATRHDLQISMQLVPQGESPSSSASDVDNLNNQSTIDKTLLSKSIVHLGNQVVARNLANFSRILDFTSDVNLAMEASMKSQNAYKATNATLEQIQNKETIVSVKRVVDFSFQDVKELVYLVENARKTINRQGFKGNKRQ